MNLKDFEDEIDPIILERGMDYYDSGNVGRIVERIEEGKPDHYTVLVSGGSDYTVDVMLDKNNEIVETSCDCPYDWGPYCKHQAAAFYALRNSLAGDRRKPEPHKHKRKPQSDLYEELNLLSKEELLSIIIDLANENEDIKERLLYQHTQEETLLRESRKLVAGSIRRAEGRNGFIEWNRADQALEGAEMVLGQVQSQLENGKGELAASLCLIVLPQVVDMLQYCDDSDGGPGAVINQSLNMLAEAVSSAEQSSQSVKRAIFNKIMNELQNERYDGWSDWRNQMLDALIPLCRTGSLRKKWEEAVDHLIAVPQTDSWSLHYERERLLYLKLKLMEFLEEKQDARQFLYQHIRLASFRERAIRLAVSRDDWKEVLRLCKDGEKSDRKDSPEYVEKWMRYRLQAYEHLGNTNGEKELMLRFLYAGDYSYYEILAGLYSAEEWGKVSEEIIAHFEQSSHLPAAYVKILIHEKRYERLLDYCKNRPYEIKTLYVYLAKPYPNEVEKIFAAYIENEAETSRNRSQYRQVCSIIRTFKKACGNQAAGVLIGRLKQQYARRPAFVDELNKVG
ncbi:MULTISPECIES: SWIM zinc finger family protein [unclassified Sporolactobacillus]|uniref:SWIM zinc finger family protein n=1 Tax=unclassified Sporolactobacillus TaxID=2628533 RepID=UPI0023676804|nr:SWIM zinc finger family protein [Sporolactobacillus sp. CQH2019]MDD9149845.1 SWIM zinc finger family protein [Sporolactobacillus sp. CQH2019]